MSNVSPSIHQAYVQQLCYSQIHQIELESCIKCISSLVLHLLAERYLYKEPNEGAMVHLSCNFIGLMCLGVAREQENPRSVTAL